MGIASQGEGTGKGSSGHQAKGVQMGMRRIPHRGPAPGPVVNVGLPASVQQTVQNPPQGPSGS